MKGFRIIVFTLCLMGIAINAQSQGNFMVHLGPAVPLSGFASDDIDNDDSGGAAVGVNVGVQYIYPLSESGFGIFGGIDFNYNGLKKDVKDYIEELYESFGIAIEDIKYYSYFNIPLTLGLNYTYQADDKIGVFANTGLALNLLKITNLELESNGQTVMTQIDVAYGIGFKVGGGVLINQKYSISIDYLALGKHDIEGKVKSPVESQDFDGEQKVDLLTLTVAYIF